MESLSRIIQKITLNDHGDHHCINYLYLFATKSKLKLNENVCKNHNYCHMVMTKEDKNILKYNEYKKSSKTPSFMPTQNHCLKKLIHYRK